MGRHYKISLNIFMVFVTIFLFIMIEKNEKFSSVILLSILTTVLLLNLLRLIKSKPTEKISLRNPKQAYIDAFENSASLAKIGLNFNIKYVNRSFCQLTLYAKENCLDKNLDDFLENQPEIREEIYETLKCNQSWEGILLLHVNYHNQVYIKCSIVPILDANGLLQEYLLIAHDLTELMMSKKIIQDNIYIDTHTKLPNRMQLIKDKLKFLSKQDMTLILLNIDSFQAINSIYGNKFGDEVLIITAKWLENNLPLKDTKLYKFESDVYAMLIPFSYDEDDLKIYLENLSKKVTKDGVHCLGIDVNITFTIGAVQGKSNLLKLVSIAYKEAKKAKKAFMIYDISSKKEEEYVQNINIIKVIKKSLKEDRIVPYFQPIMNSKTNIVDKYETLMRIKKDDESVYTPYEFLDISKHSKLYPALSRNIIKKAFDTFKLSSDEFSVNLSFLDIENQTTMDYIFKKLSEYDIGSWVIFEILESEGINNYNTVLKFIEKAKSYGAKIAIDDFGSGYSNFERLVKLQPDYIKIDGGLIKNIDKNEDMRIITQTIVNFAKELGTKTIAEYVHSKEVFDIIKNMGVDFAQGYYIGKPSPRLNDKGKGC